MADPSEVTVSSECKNRQVAYAQTLNNPAAVRYVQRRFRTANEALEQFPRDAFDYVWLIHPEEFTPRLRPGLRLVWSGPNSWLFEVNRQPGST